ncbi:MAG: hypothetical protein PVG53_10660 [Holophagae bacterium]|jgi:hypothetical protein
MARLIQVSLTVLISVAVTALIMALVLPAHARSGAAEPAAASDIRHAVLTEHLGASSGDAAATCPALPRPGPVASCPALEGVAPKGNHVSHGLPEASADAVSGCPYLSSLAARTGCPALSTRTESTTCPYSPEKIRPDANPPSQGSESRSAQRAPARV